MCMNTMKTNSAAETHTSECPFPGQPECWGLSWHAAPTGTLTPAFWVSNLACSLEKYIPHTEVTGVPQPLEDRPAGFPSSADSLSLTGLPSYSQAPFPQARPLYPGICLVYLQSVICLQLFPSLI